MPATGQGGPRQAKREPRQAEGGVVDEVKEGGRQTYLRPLRGERNAPGHDGIRTGGANRMLGQGWPTLFSAFPPVGPTCFTITRLLLLPSLGELVSCSPGD